MMRYPFRHWFRRLRQLFRCERHCQQKSTIRRFVFLFVLLSSIASAQTQQSSTSFPRPIPLVSTLSTSCTVGEVVFKTSAMTGLYQCATVNTWTAVGSGAGGAPTDATYLTQTANGTLSNEQPISALTTGVLRGTTTTGVVSSLGDGDPADDQVLVASSSSAAAWKTIPNCTDTGGNHLNYTQSSNTLACGTSGGGSGSPGSPVDSLQINLSGAFAGLGHVNDTDWNTFFGYDSGTNLTSGLYNTGYGKRALRALTSGPENTAFGIEALRNLTTGSYNTAVGSDAGLGITTGDGNVAIGRNALPSITTTSFNIGIGYGALESKTSGAQTVAIGYHALQATTSDSDTVAVGSLALTAQTTGTANVALGYSACSGLTTGSVSVCIGRENGSGVAGAMTGEANMVIGGHAGDYLTSGSSNILLGRGAGDQAASHVGLTTGSQNIFIGDTPGIANAASQVDNSMAIGYSVEVSQSNRAVIGNGDLDDAYFGSETAEAKVHARQFIGSGSTPSVSNTSLNSCGTTAATIAGTDTTGVITVGATAGSDCTVTFTTAAPTRRQCWANNETTGNLTRYVYVDTTNGKFQGTFVAGDLLSYGCLVY